MCVHMGVHVFEHIVFHSGCANLKSHQPRKKIRFAYNSANAYILSLFYNNHSNKPTVTSLGVFIPSPLWLVMGIFSYTWWLLMCSLGINNSRSFAHFKILLLSFLNSLSITELSPYEMDGV